MAENYNNTNPFLQREDRNRQPPDRYGEWHSGTLPPLLGPFGTSTPHTGGANSGANNEDAASVRSHRSHISNISRVSQTEVRRRVLEVELRAAEDAAKVQEEVQRKQAEVKLALIRKREELEKAIIDEEIEANNFDNNSQKLSDDEEENSPAEKKNIIQTTPDKTKHLTLPNSSRASTPIHDMYCGDVGTSEAINKIAEALSQTLKIVGDQARAPQRNDTANARRTIGRELSAFGGDPDEWPAFISEYKECAELCEFTARENLQRLKKALRGEAKQTVQALLTSPENVDKILETLELRFGTPELIVQRMIDKAKKADRVKDDKIESLLNFATLVQNLATTAASLNCDNYMSNPQLMLDLMDKLPMSWKKDWCRHSNVMCKKSPSVVDFADWLSSEAKVFNKLRLATSCASEVQSTAKDGKSKIRTKQKAVLATGGAEESTTNKKEEKSSSQKPCVHCKKTGHDITTCYTFKKLDLDAKWKWVREHQVCYCCLKIGHQSKICRNKKACGIDNCKEFHHKILHRVIKKSDDTKSEVKPEVGGAKEKSEVLVQQSSGNKVLYKIAHVTLKGPAGQLNTCAFLDEGSSYTLLDAKVAEDLGITGDEEPLTLRGIGNLSCRDKESQKVSLKICGANGKEFDLHNVRTKSSLGLPSQGFDLSDLPFNWKSMKNLRLKPMNYEKPMILIGLDNNDLIHTQKTIQGSNHRLTLGKTKLGWTVYGNIVGGANGEFSMHLNNTSTQDEDLHDMVKQYFQAESDGVKVLKETLSSKNDARAISLMEKNTARVGGAWETCLIWKQDDIVMPSSKSAAYKRLTSVERKMDKDPILAKLYCEKMQYFFDNNYARKLSEDDACQNGPRTWYLPHFGILNPNKPGKLRFVFDAAAKSNNVSLNDNLLTGPDLLLSLPGCLIKFRQRKVGFTGDIRDFFPSVRMKKEDQDAQRFIWRGMDRDRAPDTYSMIVNIFGAACTPFTSQAAKNKNAQEFQHEFPAAVKAILYNHYMDDYLDSVDSEDEAIKLILDVIEVHKRGGFEIGKFTASHKAVLLQIPQHLRATETVNLELDNDLNVERVLGLHWDPNSDTLSFNLKFHKIEKEIVTGEKRPSKRQVLRVVMSMFDPLGFLGNYTVQAKILLQDIWRSGIGWDDEISDQLNNKWKNWIVQLHELEILSIPRCFGSTTNIQSRQLHVFCDASEQAYCAVAYLRIENSGAKEVQVSLIMSKTRVSPLKPMTIPRLELQAAVIGSRLSNFIKSQMELELTSTIFWSDSKTVLLWLRSEARNFKTFVAHRVGEILEQTNVNEWKWIPSKENVADDATRDNQSPNLTPNSRWLNGPEFLKLSKENWPKEVTVNELKQEVSPDDMEISQDAIWTILEDQILIDVTRFSKWWRLNRSMAWVLRYVNNIKRKARGQDLLKSELTPHEVHLAEAVLIKQAQLEMFGGDILHLQKRQLIPKTSPLAGLSAFVDTDGILKINSRIKNAPVAEETKYPIILHGKHSLTKLLVMYHHVMGGHHGHDRVVNDLRQKYWIIQIRASVKHAWLTCQECKNRRAKPLVPEMGQLPWVRLAEAGRAFTFTGMDYFGPFDVVEGRRSIKNYGVLFTCLSTRAVHLEIAESLTTDSAIMAIRRFVARRGKPKRIYSDNGTNLRGADNELRDSLHQMNQMALEVECTAKCIEWHFIPPSAPHMGGSWERMVQSVKKALRATLENTKRTPRREVLQTLFAEAENTVNSRPLTHVSLDPHDAESLTPNHFLIGSSGALAPPGDFSGAADLRKQWRMAEQLATHFWRRWVKEYLPTLTRRTKWHQMVKPVVVGDIVVIVDDQLERNSWPLGRITNIFPGKDGKVRVVEVLSKGKVYKRPVTKICVMDVMDKTDQEGASSAPDGLEEVGASSAPDPTNEMEMVVAAPKVDVEDADSTSEGKMSRLGLL